MYVSVTGSRDTVHLQQDFKSRKSSAFMAATSTDEPLMTIGQVARQAGLRTSHIRFYERVGVLPESVDVCGLFVDPTLLPPGADIDLDVRHIRRPAADT
jgi:hypothetical protein